MLIYSNFNLKAAWTEGVAEKQSPGEKGELWPFTPAGARALITSITLFNFNPLINKGNHTSPSSDGENTPLERVHFLEGVGWKKGREMEKLWKFYKNKRIKLRIYWWTSTVLTSTRTIYGRVLGPLTFWDYNHKMPCRHQLVKLYFGLRFRNKW